MAGVLSLLPHTAEARAKLRESIFDRNGVNGEAARLLFPPLMWERDAVTELGHPPQRILNRQLVDRSDGVFATFWSRLGRPTDKPASGTAEEIDRAVGFSQQTIARRWLADVRPART